MYKILLLFSSFYSLSLSLSLHHRAATKRQEMEGERERTLGKIAKPEEEKERVVSLSLKNEWCDSYSSARRASRFFLFFCGVLFGGGARVLFFFFLEFRV